MNIMQYPRMLTSTHEGWDELERWHPDMNALFLWLVLPLSVLPPVMILLASGGWVPKSSRERISATGCWPRLSFSSPSMSACP